MDQLEELINQETKRQETATKKSDKRNIMGALLASYDKILNVETDNATVKSLIDRAEKIADMINERI
jgi:hypothetical protein